MAILFLTGCSDYMRRWESPIGSGKLRDPYEGSYAGTWESSQYKGTSGKLWCILTRVGPEQYKAQFRATWHGVFKSEHTIVLKLTGRKQGRGRPAANFVGETIIHMWIGSGRYRCAGQLSLGELAADYQSDYDTGKFQLRLIKQPPVGVGTRVNPGIQQRRH